MRALCVNDKALPEGAVVEAGKEYSVDKVFVNNWGQRTFLLSGIPNEGTTSRGLRWHGYAATRFAVLSKSPVEAEVEAEEYLEILN